MATKVWISSHLITINLCMVEIFFLRKTLFNMATVCSKYVPTKVFRRIYSHSKTEIEVGRGCGHQTLDSILFHHNESVHG